MKIKNFNSYFVDYKSQIVLNYKMMIIFIKVCIKAIFFLLIHSRLYQKIVEFTNDSNIDFRNNGEIVKNTK